MLFNPNSPYCSLSVFNLKWSSLPIPLQSSQASTTPENGNFPLSLLLAPPEPRQCPGASQRIPQLRHFASVFLLQGLFAVWRGILGRMKNLHQARSAPQLVTMRPSEIRVEELTGVDQAPAGATSYHQGSVFPLSGLALPPVAPVSLLSHTPCFTVPYFSPSSLPAWSLPTLLNLARVPSFHRQPN